MALVQVVLDNLWLLKWFLRLGELVYKLVYRLGAIVIRKLGFKLQGLVKLGISTTSFPRLQLLNLAMQYPGEQACTGKISSEHLLLQVVLT